MFNAERLDSYKSSYFVRFFATSRHFLTSARSMRYTVVSHVFGQPPPPPALLLLLLLLL
jgi:hypothetical protein